MRRTAGEGAPRRGFLAGLWRWLKFFLAALKDWFDTGWPGW